jgi:HAD superfamily hydrolase (TIGR01484 family)
MATSEYKAIIFDLDGTAIPGRREGMPSKVVTEAVQAAQSLARVATASARSAQMCAPIWEEFGLNDLCIVRGGAKILHSKTGEVLLEHFVPEVAIPEILAIFRDVPVSRFYLNDDAVDLSQVLVGPFNSNTIVASGISHEINKLVQPRLLGLVDILVQSLPSWVENNPFDVHISHILSTKRYSTERLIEIWGLSKEQVIGVGDGVNDLELFEAVGLRVAMGNAIPELKAAADLVTDTLEEDGLARVIREYLL